MTAHQLRMARAGLNWTIDEIAKHSGVARNTVYRAINDQASAGTMALIEKALMAAGVEFEGLNGVRVYPV